MSNHSLLSVPLLCPQDEVKWCVKHLFDQLKDTRFWPLSISSSFMWITGSILVVRAKLPEASCVYLLNILSASGILFKFPFKIIPKQVICFSSQKGRGWHSAFFAGIILQCRVSYRILSHSLPIFMVKVSYRMMLVTDMAVFESLQGKLWSFQPSVTNALIPPLVGVFFLKILVWRNTLRYKLPSGISF